MSQRSAFVTSMIAYLGMVGAGLKFVHSGGHVELGVMLAFGVTAIMMMGMAVLESQNGGGG